MDWLLEINASDIDEIRLKRKWYLVGMNNDFLRNENNSLLYSTFVKCALFDRHNWIEWVTM